MLSSADLQHERQALEKVGFVAALTKPVKQSQLYGCLADVVQGRVVTLGDGRTEHAGGTSQAARRPRRVRVLVAEDNSVNQRVVLKLLERFGCRAEAVTNGREALAALELAPYDVVLMDVQMPDMDGLETTRRIRTVEAAEGRPGLPIIALTANAMRGDRERCLEAGMSDYISKPVDAGDLENALRRCLGRKWSDEGDAAASAAGGRPPPKPEGFCAAELLTLLSGDRAFVRDVLVAYADDAPAQMRRLRDALAAGDAESVCAHAHALKGASASIVAQAVSEAAGGLERAAASGQLEQASSLLDELEARLASLLRAVADWLEADATPKG